MAKPKPRPLSMEPDRTPSNHRRPIRFEQWRVTRLGDKNEKPKRKVSPLQWKWKAQTHKGKKKTFFSLLFLFFLFFLLCRSFVDCLVSFDRSRLISFFLMSLWFAAWRSNERRMRSKKLVPGEQKKRNRKKRKRTTWFLWWFLMIHFLFKVNNALT